MLAGFESRPAVRDRYICFRSAAFLSPRESCTMRFSDICPSIMYIPKKSGNRKVSAQKILAGALFASAKYILLYCFSFVLIVGSLTKSYQPI